MMTIQSCARFGISIALVTILHCIGITQYSSNNFVRYTSKDGLSDNYITAIQQDSLGFLWVGTENGLNRFDGYAFKNYFFDSPTGFLASSIIRKLVLFNQHELGIVSYGGFQILDPLTMSMRNFLIPDSTSFVSLKNAASDVAKLKNGHYALTTATGFYVLNANGKIDYRYDAYTVKDYGTNPIRYGRQIIKPGSDVLVYHESMGLSHFDPESKSYTQVDPTNAKWKTFMHSVGGEAVRLISKSQIEENEFILLFAQDSLIYYDYEAKRRVSSPLPIHWENEFEWSSQVIKLNDSLMAITGAYSGLYFLKLDRLTGRIYFNSDKVLPDYKILTLFQDRENRLWVGTKTGLLRQVIDQPLIEKFIWPDPSDRSFGFTDAIIHDSILYISRQNPESGLVAIDIKSMETLKEFNFGNKYWNIVSSLKMYHEDTIWMGTHAGLIWLDTETWNFNKVQLQDGSRKENFQFDVLSDPGSDGIAWMAQLLEGRVARYKINSRNIQIIDKQSNPPIPFSMIKHLAYDSFGDVWLGGHSLARWNHQTMEFDTLISVYGGSHKYNDDILAMVADDAGSLWLHNAENGLLQYKIRERSFRQISMKDGLPSNTIIALSPVVDGILFMSTPHNLVRLDTRNYEIEIFGNESDLPEENSIARSMYWDKQGKKMYAFYKSEIIRFPLTRPVSNLEGNNIIVQELEINNERRKFYPDDRIRLKHKENTLAIYYTIIDFEQSNDYQFAYNFDNAKEWTSVAAQRIIHLTNLQPGEHHLQIRATGKSGKQKVSHFNFSMERPFWNQAWFFPFIAIFISAFIYLIFRIREIRIREKANLDNQIAAAEMKALHAQMNPHFIFNSLNSIKEMVLQNEVKDASRYLSDFAHLIRMTLDHSRQTFVSLRSTMEYLSWYVKMEQLRNSNFHFHMEAESSIDPDDTLIPPMLIQPFIENAIWHGADGKRSTIHIRVLFKKRGDQLICTIDDDGIGIEKGMEKKNGSKSSHTSVGINNIQKRIDLLNQKHHFKSRIEITDKHIDGNGTITGTIVKITLPIEIEEPK